MPDHVTTQECEIRCGAYQQRLEAIEKDVACYEKKYIEMSRWQAEHDGRINAWWESQFKLNTFHEQSLGGVYKRLTAVEKRVIWASGFSAAVGAVLGSVGTFLITKLFG